MAMKKSFLLIVVFASLCIGIMGLKPRRQGHDLVNGKMDLNMGHDLNNGLQQHKINNHKEYDQDTYEQQTTPDDSESSATSSINHDGTTYHKKSLLKSRLQHKLFSDDQSTTDDSYGHYATASEMSSYDHYYGNKGHKFGNNLNNNQHDNHDQYSHDMYDNHNNYDANHDSYDSHHLKQQAHKQNDLDQPNKGQRRYYVDDSSLRQGLRQQDTSSVKVRDYVDYNKQLAGKPISGNTIINRHSLGDIDSSSASSVSHHDKVFYQHNKLNHNDEESTSQSSQSIQLHNPNDDQYIISHKKAKQITHQQGVHQEEVHDATGNVELPQESHQFTTSTTSLPEHNNKQATTYHDTSSPTN